MLIGGTDLRKIRSPGYPQLEKLQHGCIRWAPNAQDRTYKTNTVGEKTARTKLKIDWLDCLLKSPELID